MDDTRGQVPVALVTVLPERKASTTAEVLAAICREGLAVHQQRSKAERWRRGEAPTG